MKAATMERPSVERDLVGGRYLLSRQLAVGGMAEIYLAYQRIDDGVDKEVVIKRLKPELCKSSRVAEMFADEARLGAYLSHPHNVQIFDSGEHERVPYIAMEYIRGEEMNVLCRRGLQHGQFLPLPHAVELVRQAAVAMGYYHNLRDADGDALDLVHCDISPNNLLVTSDGFLKVIDFGIARFRGQSYRHAQVVPGKLSYMSPEQAQRKALDRRSDIYSLGIVLYEITLGKRLFRGPAAEIVEQLKKGEVRPPTFVRNDYPGALESIVMRALEPEPSERFQEAYDLADALAEYLRDEKMRTGAPGIARYLDRLSVAAGGARREELIAEDELEAGEDELDFDRDIFSSFVAARGADPEAARNWEEVEEGEGAVADVLGIDVELVRHASRAAPSEETTDAEPPTNGRPARDVSPASRRLVAEGAPHEERAAKADEKRETRPASPAPSGGIAAFLVGLLLGIAATLVALYFLS